MSLISDVYDVIIIGGGIAGFSAAMYGGRLKLNTLVITSVRGGVIIQTNDIANWPGIEKTDGMSLAGNIEKHATSYQNVNVLDDTVTKVKKAANGF
ncbi:hypothetical protein KKD40_03575 [Candidatus Micrarchaeota archaeon]|nr:hypothetical protein [Candidatus Micrarchaeota archaeon]